MPKQKKKKEKKKVFFPPHSTALIPSISSTQPCSAHLVPFQGSSLLKGRQRASSRRLSSGSSRNKGARAGGKMEPSRKRRNPYSDEVTSESKAIKFDQKTIEGTLIGLRASPSLVGVLNSDPLFIGKAKTWAILMNPENRRALNTPRAKVTAVRRSDSPAVDSVKGLASDLTFDNCVGCQKPTKDTNSCSHCHRIICDRCSGVCESCMYHFCPICRTVKYEKSKSAHRPISSQFYPSPEATSHSTPIDSIDQIAF